jgi:hypothetical protein
MECISHAAGKDCQQCAPSTTHLSRSTPPTCYCTRTHIFLAITFVYAVHRLPSLFAAPPSPPTYLRRRDSGRRRQPTAPMPPCCPGLYIRPVAPIDCTMPEWHSSGSWECYRLVHFLFSWLGRRGGWECIGCMREFWDAPGVTSAVLVGFCARRPLAQCLAYGGGTDV